jgi:hypothetical protein
MSMSNQRPEVTDEEIGMRTFQIKRARAVERATDRMRQGLKGDWTKFSEPEVETLQWALGEVWAYVAHTEWDELRFGLLTITDVRKILNFGRELMQHSRNSVDVLNDVYDVVKARG